MSLSSHNSDDENPTNEINVTPLVDVMLVLLAIFMITAPALFNGVKVKLPQTKRSQSLRLEKKKLILNFKASGDLYLGKQKLLESELSKIIKEQLKERKDQTLYLRADESLRYGKVAALMASLKSSGVTALALVTQARKE